MTVAADQLQELSDLCGEGRELMESGRTYIYLPRRKLPRGCIPAEVEGLLCIQDHSGYPTLSIAARQWPWG